LDSHQTDRLTRERIRCQEKAGSESCREEGIHWSPEEEGLTRNPQGFSRTAQFPAGDWCLQKVTTGWNEEALEKPSKRVRRPARTFHSLLLRG